jgi:hypothetical protein
MKQGKRDSCIYGRFKGQDGVNWLAHRWAAKFIHGLDLIDGNHIDHCCEVDGKPRPNTLCVQHVQSISSVVNLRLRWSRYWDYWCDGDPDGPESELEENRVREDGPPPVPFFHEPNWLRKPNKGNTDDPPF